MVSKDEIEQFGELTQVDKLEKGEYISTLQWNNKQHKDIILRERRKRRNMYFKLAIEQQKIEQANRKAIREARKKRRIE